MSTVDNYIEFIKEAELLKGVLRTAWQSAGRQESTAEHSWRLALLASVMLEEFQELDESKVLTMCLIHDLGEVYEGDISAVLLPNDTKKIESERKAVERLFSFLPSVLKEKYMNIWMEYVNASSDEALFVKALDKAETIIQHNQGQNPKNFDYAFNLDYGKKYFQSNKILMELRKKLDLDTKRRLEEGSVK